MKVGDIVNGIKVEEINDGKIKGVCEECGFVYDNLTVAWLKGRKAGCNHRKTLTGPEVGEVINNFEVISVKGSLLTVRCVRCGELLTLPYSKILVIRNQRCNHNNISWGNITLQNLFHRMRARCYSVNDKAYPKYGERGIRICDDWNNHPLAFENWCLENGWEPGLTISLIDPDRDYSPENCEFVPIRLARRCREWHGIQARRNP